MPHAQRTITINAPVDQVFAFLTDPANDPRWRSGVASIRREGDPAAGTIVRQTIARPMGRGIAADIEITDYEPTTAYAFRGIAGPVRPVGSFTFAPAGSGTEVTFSLEAELSGLKGMVLARQVQKSMDAEMAALDTAKSLLEG